MTTRTRAEIAEEYAGIWRNFAQVSREFHDGVVQDVEAGNLKLHDALCALQSVPYWEARGLLSAIKVDSPAVNIGAMTGFFFEHSVASLLVPWIANA